MADVKRRPYRTTIRRGDAPALICAAAYRLFSDKGYLATSIEDIAAEAGVARPTIFTAVGPEGDHPAPRRRSSPRRRRRTGPDRPATLVARGHRRARPRAFDPTARPQHVPDQPARRTGATRARDRRVRRRRSRRVWDRFQQQRHDGLNEFAVALTRKTNRVRYDESTITDTLCMLAADAYLRLVRDAGWPPERYQDWLTDVLLRLFLD